MEEENLESTIMGLILSSGEAKSLAVEAIRAAKSGQFDEAENKLKLAQEALLTAHKSQTALLRQEAQGEGFAVSLLIVHNQDHLMTSITFVDLAKEIVELHRKF